LQNAELYGKKEEKDGKKHIKEEKKEEEEEDLTIPEYDAEKVVGVYRYYVLQPIFKLHVMQTKISFIP